MYGTHASLVRTALVRSLDSIGATPRLGAKAEEEGKGGGEEEREEEKEETREARQISALLITCVIVDVTKLRSLKLTNLHNGLLHGEDVVIKITTEFCNAGSYRNYDRGCA